MLVDTGAHAMRCDRAASEEGGCHSVRITRWRMPSRATVLRRHVVLLRGWQWRFGRMPTSGLERLRPAVALEGSAVAVGILLVAVACLSTDVVASSRAG